MRIAFTLPGRLVCLALVFGLLVTACRLSSRQALPPGTGGLAKASPAPPSPSSPAGPTGRPGAAAPGESDLLLACDPAAQEAALLPGQLPDWESLPLAACYQLSLELQPGPDYTGRALITVANPSGDQLDELVFRLYPNSAQIYGGELRISAARVQGETVTPETFLEDRTALRLPLPDPLPAGSFAQVELEFAGRAALDLAGSIYGIHYYDRQGQVLTLANAYPILAEWEAGGWQAAPVEAAGDAVVSQASLYRVDIHAPAGWQVAATGSALTREDTGEGVRVTFASGPARDFILVASPRLEESRVQAGEVQIHHWGLPGGEARWAEARQAAADSLRLFEQSFGTYPYRELDIVAVPLRLASGVEYPGLILIGESQYGQSARGRAFLGVVVSHEVAHQWWYGLVGNDVLEHPWQDEALATFSSLLYEQVYQPDYYRGMLDSFQTEVQLEPGTAAGDAIDQPVEAFSRYPRAYGTLVYQKGALFFVALQEKIGTGAFFSALQAYESAERYALASPEDLLASFETACSCSLESFYRAWGVK